jgi:hypothetical protein
LINLLVKKRPIKIRSGDKVIKKLRKMVFHCGMTKFESSEKKDGWCATKLDRRGNLAKLEFSLDQSTYGQWELKI